MKWFIKSSKSPSSLSWGNQISVLIRVSVIELWRSGMITSLYFFLLLFRHVKLLCLVYLFSKNVPLFTFEINIIQSNPIKWQTCKEAKQINLLLCGVVLKYVQYTCERHHLLWYVSHVWISDRFVVNYHWDSMLPHTGIMIPWQWNLTPTVPRILRRSSHRHAFGRSAGSVRRMAVCLLCLWWDLRKHHKHS